MIEQAMVHGRFQPLHYQHLEYILSGLSRCNQVVIGITNPEPSEHIHQEESPHRATLEANPFSYFDRLRMITACLKESGVELARVNIVPFHLSRPDKWSSFLPHQATVVHLVRIFSDWERRKATELERHGFKVARIDSGVTKRMTGTAVRQAIREGQDWQKYVPASARPVVAEYAAGFERK